MPRSVLLALACLALPPAASAAGRPNVLIVMTDDQGLGDFSYTGNPVLKTPNLDAFARRSVRLTDFHAAPMCSPTRGQLLTGLAALRNGATAVTAGRTFMRPGLPTLPEVFAKAGYRTGIFGKWHLGDNHPHRPTDRGFHESVYHKGWGQLLSIAEFDMPLIDGRYFHNGVEKRYKGHCTDFWFDQAMAWMRRCKGRNEPFFCYLPTNAPHDPHIDLEEYIKPYRKPGQPAGFFGMIAHVDKRFGDLEKFLVEQKLKDDTIVVFTTDNGGTAGVRTFNAGLRDGKTSYYEGGHRVPCWVRWPAGKLGDPRDVKTPTQNTDLLPTLCELCGVAPPKRDKADELFAGISLAALLRGTRKELPDRKFVVQYGHVFKPFDSCVIWGRWRLVQGEELYDVEADLAQKVNLADKHPGVLKVMRGHYETWWKGVEPMRNEYIPSSVGAKQQPVVELTSSDWEGVFADDTACIRETVGGPTGGHWNLVVEQAGEYELTLRRWPAQTKAALGGRYEPSARSPSSKEGVVTRGFPAIARARVEIAGVKAEVRADPKAPAVTLSVKLPAGKTRLKAWFADAGAKDLCAAFYVTVKRKR